MRGPALAILECTSVARGVVVADAALKRAPAVLVSSRAVSAGKHLVILEGGEAEVEESLGAGKRVAGDRLLDWLLLPGAADLVWPMLEGAVAPPDWSHEAGAEAVAIVETQTVCAAIAAADAAVKCTDVIIRDVRLAIDLAGKAYFTLTGEQSSIEAATAAAAAVAADRLVGAEVIAQPAPELRGRLFR